jgi:diaminopimelate decarboxylase
MTELIRPALYGARHDIVALTSGGRPWAVPGGMAGPEPTSVHGPICESTDELGVHDLPPLDRGDLVAIRDAGAYAASQSSTYNGRPRPPQVASPSGSPSHRCWPTVGWARCCSAAACPNEPASTSSPRPGRT